MALKSTGLTIPINVQHLNEVIVSPNITNWNSPVSTKSTLK